MKAFLRIGVVFVSSLLFTLPLVGAAQPSQPNIVLILADDLGYGDLGCYPKDPQNPDAPAISPHIDSLAAQGVKFTQAYSSPMCSPARAALLSGKYTGRFGFYGNEDAHVGLPKTELILPELLRQTGYATACIGKWHVGHQEGYRPLERGFDRFYGFLGAAHDYFKVSRGTDTDGELYEGSWIWDQDKKVEDIKYLTEQFTDEALRFIDQAQKQNKPFFLYLPYNAPHGPEQAPADDLDEFARYPNIKCKGRTAVRAMIDNLDRNIGRITRELFLRGLDQNTIVIFASDNGGNEYEEPAGIRTVEHNGGLRGRKFTLWEGGVRVPLIIRWPGSIGKGMVYEKPVLLLDLYATLAKAAGADPNLNQSPDSVDLIPFVQGKNGVPHETIHSFITNTWSIRKGDWKLVFDRDSLFIPTGDARKPLFGLFNLAADPGERNNLVEKEPETAKSLKALHAKLLEEFKPAISRAK